MNWNHVKPLESEDSISEFERKYKFTFPDDFKETVLKYNRGYPELDVYDTDKTQERTIKHLLSFNKSDRTSIWKIIEWNKEELDGKYIAIAIDSFGNLICFSIKDSSIIFIDLETLKTEMIANSFSEFLNKLYDGAGGARR